MHIVCFYAVFIYYFNCISFAIRLSGRKVAIIKLIETDWNWTWKTKNSAIADKLRDAFRGQSKSPNMVPFHMLGMVYTYNCAIVTLSVRDIRLQKWRDLHNRVRGPWRSLKMSPFDRESMTSYWCSIVTRTLACVVSEIFNVEKYRDLEIRARDHSRSLKVVEFDRLDMLPISVL